MTPAYKVAVTLDQAVAACSALAERPHLGLDIETFAAGPNTDGKAALDPFRNKVRLLQLGTAEAATIFDLGQLGCMPDALRAILEGPSSKIGHNLAFDTQCLLHHYGVEVANPTDTYVGAVLTDGQEAHRSLRNPAAPSHGPAGFTEQPVNEEILAERDKMRQFVVPSGQNTKPYADGSGRLVLFDTYGSIERALDRGKIIAGFVITSR
jgi:hypothetical protein